MSIRKLIEIAEAEIGYLEKKSNKDLDSKTKNAGRGNYTKYWRDLKPSFQGEPWCQCFVNWCFVQVYGKTNAKRLLHQDEFDYYTPTCAQAFKDAGRWFNTPKVGDVVYFKNSTRIHHVGIVVTVATGSITTIEGNTSIGKQVIANGGGVWSKSYGRNNTDIAGYGRPDYAAIPKGWVKDLYKYALDRLGTTSEVSWWANRLASGLETGCSAAKGFYLGKEYEQRHRDNKEYLDDLYHGLLGRAGEEGGQQYWQKLLDSGRLTREDVLHGFCTSAEFINVCRSYGIDRGEW